MNSNEETILSKLISDDQYIRLVFCDIAGQSHSKIIPARHALKILKNGAGFCSVAVVGGCLAELYAPQLLVDMKLPNAYMHIDLCTYSPLRWLSEGDDKTSMFLCDVKWENGEPFSCCVRSLAKNQLHKLSNMGYSFLSSFELEFMLLKKDSLKPVFDHEMYMTTLAMVPVEKLLKKVEKNAKAMGIDIEAFHTEHSEGMFEMVLSPEKGIKAADNAFLLHFTIKELALEEDIIATFISKLHEHVDGNGTHLNFSLWDVNTDENIFYDRDGIFKLSSVAKYWLGGLLKHLSSLIAIFCPTVNCYRRFANIVVPNKNTWGFDDRFTAVRVKSSESRNSTYLENRVPSGLSNYYLNMAATIAAGLDGIHNKIEPPPNGDYDQSVSFPKTLEEALQLLESNAVMKDAFGEEFIQWFVENKRKTEIEVLKYFDPFINNAETFKKEFEKYGFYC